MKQALLLMIGFLLAANVTAQFTEINPISSATAPPAIGPYSQAIQVGNIYFLSGQIAIDPVTGGMDTLSVQQEVERIMKNIGVVLEAAGLDYSRIVKTTIFTTDLAYFKVINETYASFLREPYPARETVQVAALPKKARVEISVIAVR